MPGISGTDKALMYAQFGPARFGATRFGYHSAKWFLTIAGVQRRGNVEQGTLVITDALDEVPNTLHMSVVGITPTKGQEVIVMLGSTDNRERLFAGHILTVTTRYDGRLTNDVRDVSALDYTWLLDKKVTARYASQSATAIAAALIDSYTSGFTTRRIAAGLELIDEITFTNEDVATCLTRLAKRIGGYWYVDALKDVHFWVGTEANQANPVALTTSHISVTDFMHQDDLRPVLTRVFVEGRGSRLLGAVAVGETRIPLEAVDMFDAAGEFLKVSFQGSQGGAQHLTFTGVVAGGEGTIIGPGVTPSGPLSAALAAGTGITAGSHDYAYTWVTASGETLPSPSVTIATGVLAAPGTAPIFTGSDAGSIEAGYHDWAVTFVTAAGETTRSARATVWSGGTTSEQFTILTGATGVTARKLYRTAAQATPALAAAAQLKLAATISDNTTTSVLNNTADASLGANVPTTNTAAAEQMALSGIAVGPSGTTDRKVYRTAAGGSQLKLLTTLANNTATTYADAIADGSLGANVPTSDTSALTQPDGQVLPGATSLTVAGTGAFESGGGWAVIGNGTQVIRYTGLSGGTLTGVPASGTGAIVAAIAYNSTITACPMLTGIPASSTGSIQIALAAGDEVYLVVQRDDLAAQDTLAALIGGGDDGIREEWLQDRRLSIAEAQARGDAWLALRSVAEGRITYACRDKTTKAGRTITVTSLNGITGTFKIQDVRIADFSEAAARFPTYQVEASTSRFSFEDLLRQARRGHS